MKIRLIGERCWVWLNDQVVVDNARLHNFFDEAKGIPLPKTGPIQLQTHGAEIRFKNLVVDSFDAEESNKLLQEAKRNCMAKISLFAYSMAKTCRDGMVRPAITPLWTVRSNA